jgi:hypothetical protein
MFPCDAPTWGDCARPIATTAREADPTHDPRQCSFRSQTMASLGGRDRLRPQTCPLLTLSCPDSTTVAPEIRTGLGYFELSLNASGAASYQWLRTAAQPEPCVPEPAPRKTKSAGRVAPGLWGLAPTIEVP